MTAPDPAHRAEQLFLRLMGPEATPLDWDDHERLLAESPEYRRAFEACQAAWDGMDGLDPAVYRDPPAPPLRTPRPARIFAAAATVLLALAAGFLGLRGGDSPEKAPVQFTTGIGEHRSVNLADGSRLVIGARSRVLVRYSADTRLVELAGGQLLAEVSPDAARPFVVVTDDAQAVATGTAFDVRDGAAYSTISVVEGSVRVIAREENSQLPAQALAGGTTLQAGQQLRAAHGNPVGSVQQVDTDQVTAWRQGQLYFQEDELSTVFEQVMRYSDVNFRVLDPAIEARLYSGSFRPDRLDAWLAALERAYGLRVTRHGKAWIAVAPIGEGQAAER